MDSPLFFVAIWLLNALVSFYNLYVVGKVWHSSNVVRGWTRIVVWSALIMGAAGLTWCNTTVLVGIGILTGNLSANAAIFIGKFAYLFTIGPVICSGIVLWTDSVITAYRERDLASIGTAAYTTWAMADNIFVAVRITPSLAKELFQAFWLDDDPIVSVPLLLIPLTILALGASIFTASAIVRWSAQRTARQSLGL